MKDQSLSSISGELLLAVKMERPVDSFLQTLADLSESELYIGLKTDDNKKVFWINIYNAFFQIFRKVHDLDKPEVFQNRLIDIAGLKFSLDDVEHGILRRYRWKFSLGYLPNIFTPTYLKSLAVSKIDYRIHFALNCGAKSCPPIAFYSADRIQQQLDIATQSFLEAETEKDDQKREVQISRLFQWFRADFGGSKGIREILSSQINLDSQGYKLVYNTYSWDEQLDNYSE